jgi:hypothetical protein
VFSGHEHVYERLKPQKGINYIVLGNSGQLRPHDIRPSQNTEKAFDTDRSFLLVEIAGDRLYFQTVARTGETVDSGVFTASDGKTDAFRSYTVPNSPLAAGLQE